MGFATLRDIPQKASVHIYGAGAAGRQLKRRIQQERSDVTIVNFLDTYKQGTLEGLDIIRLDSLPVHGPEGLVLVASTHWSDICTELERRSFATPLVFEPGPSNVAEYRWLGAKLHRLHREQRLWVVSGQDLPQNAKVSILGRDRAGKKARKELRASRPDLEIVSYLTFSAGGTFDGLPARHIEPEDIANEPGIAILAGHYWEESAMRVLNSGVASAQVYEQYGTIRDCVVLDQEKVIYVNVPKAASSSINQAFLQYAGFDVADPHLPIPDGIRRDIDLRDPAFDDYLKFSIVRHPWERIFSGFKSKFVRQDEFFRTPYGKEFGLTEFSLSWFLDLVLHTHDLVTDLHWRPQWRLLCDDDGELLVDRVIRMEEMGNELPDLLRAYGITLDIPHLNSTEYISKHRWKQSFDCPEEYQEMFLDKFLRDFELFGYEM